VEGKEQFYIDSDTCADHMACVSVCPVEAISLLVVSGAKKPEEEEEEEA
jgi:NAD-dependent dihydropyrimidine dehydrogenase PreA subunit